MNLPNIKGMYNVSDGFVNLRIKEDVLKRILNHQDSYITTIEPVNTTLNVTAEDQGGLSRDTQAVLYIIVVLLFYAFSMIILLVKYVRREQQEAVLNYYFYEFVQRKHFHTARYHNKTTVMSLMKQTIPLCSLMDKYELPRRLAPKPETNCIEEGGGVFASNSGTSCIEEGGGATPGTSASSEAEHRFKVTTV